MPTAFDAVQQLPMFVAAGLLLNLMPALAGPALGAGTPVLHGLPG